MISCEKSSYVVTSVKDSNTLEVNHKISIKIAGILGNEKTFEYLTTNLLSKKINIKPDIKLSKEGKLFAYINYSENNLNIPLNMSLIKMQIAEVDTSIVYDSLDVFKSYRVKKVPYEKPVLNVENLKENVFLIKTYDDSGISLGTGTGFVLEGGKYCMTNKHVLEGSSSTDIVFEDGKQFSINRIFFENHNYDFVVFGINNTSILLTGIPLTDTLFTVNDDIFVFGNPRGIQGVLSRGIISSIKADNDVIIFDAAVSPGSSGSPVVNKHGEVVGIATLKIDGCENCNVAVSVKAIKESLNRLSPN